MCVRSGRYRETICVDIHIYTCSKHDNTPSRSNTLKPSTHACISTFSLPRHAFSSFIAHQDVWSKISSSWVSSPIKKTASLITPPSLPHSFFFPSQPKIILHTRPHHHSLSRDLEIASGEEPAVQIISILRPPRRIDLMIQQNSTAVPADGARQPAVRKGALGLGAQADVLGGVGGEGGAVDPEAEEGVGEGGGVVDEDLGDVDVADEGFVVGGRLKGGGGGGVGGEGGEGGGGGRVGVCEGEGGGVGDLFVGGEGGDEECLDWKGSR